MYQFKACVNVIEACYVAQGTHPELTKVVSPKMIEVDVSTHPSVITRYQAKAERKTDCEQHLACIFIIGACNVRYRDTERDFHNEYLKDKDAYPNTFEAVLKYMNCYKTLNKPGRYKKPHRENEEKGLAFAKHGRGKSTGKKQKYNKNDESHCFHCVIEDHWANNGPELNK